MFVNSVLCVYHITVKIKIKEGGRSRLKRGFASGPTNTCTYTHCYTKYPQNFVNRTYTGLTRSFMDLGDVRQSLLQSFPAGRLQLAHAAVRLSIAAAHFVAQFAQTNALGEPLARLLFAIQPVPAKQVVLTAA